METSKWSEKRRKVSLMTTTKLMDGAKPHHVHPVGRPFAGVTAGMKARAFSTEMIQPTPMKDNIWDCRCDDKTKSYTVTKSNGRHITLLSLCLLSSIIRTKTLQHFTTQSYDLNVSTAQSRGNSNWAASLMLSNRSPVWWDCVISETRALWSASRECSCFSFKSN